MWSNFWSHYGEIILLTYTVVMTILVLVVSLLVFMERRNPYKTMAWLIVINVFPLVGIFIYLFLGQKLRRRRLIKSKYINEMKELEKIVNRQIECLNEGCDLEGEQWDNKRRLIKLLLNNANSPFTRYNQAGVLSNGQEAFKVIFNELEKAQSHIHLEYYIIRDDHVGRRLKEVLIRKAQEGVKIRIIYDAVGSWTLSSDYIRTLKENGIQIKPFLPVAFPFFNNKLNYRNHRKIIVIDGKVGFLGGLNIGDEYLGHHPKLGKWRDTHLFLAGTSVNFMQTIFLQDWEFVSGDVLHDLNYFPPKERNEEKIIQIAASGPDSDWEAIHQSYFALITSAQRSIKINTPYLVPDDGILMALKTAALSGVEVEIILPGVADHKIVYWASQSYFEELMEAGIKIFYYQPGFTHAKIISVDGEVASIGSANLDVRSFQLNFEVNAVLYDNELVAKVDADFAEDIRNSIEVDLVKFKERGFLTKVRQAGARLLSPLL